MASSYQFVARERARRFADAVRAWPTFAPEAVLSDLMRWEAEITRAPPRRPFVLTAQIKVKRFAMKLCRREFEAFARSDFMAASRVRSHHFRLMNEIRILKKYLRKLENTANP